MGQNIPLCHVPSQRDRTPQFPQDGTEHTIPGSKYVHNLEGRISDGQAILPRIRPEYMSFAGMRCVIGCIRPIW